jgi:hypothetical protein
VLEFVQLFLFFEIELRGHGWFALGEKWVEL